MVAERNRAGAFPAGASGTVTAGGRQSGHGSCAGLAKNQLNKIPCVLLFSLACSGYAGNVALPRTGDRQRADCVPAGVHSGTSRQQPLEVVASTVRSPGMETAQRGVARRGLPWPAADAGA